MDEPKISFEEFKKRIKYMLKDTESDVARKKVDYILYLANRVDLNIKDEK